MKALKGKEKNTPPKLGTAEVKHAWKLLGCVSKRNIVLKVRKGHDIDRSQHCLLLTIGALVSLTLEMEFSLFTLLRLIMQREKN